MASIYTETQKRIREADDGSVITDTTEVTRKIERSEEPDYIKLYTGVWCEFNGIPTAWRELFLQLAVHMTYASTVAEHGGQIVTTGGIHGREMRAALGWQERQWYKGLRELCSCGAIRKVGRGEYQINPSYAGRGQWKYNPRLAQGGIEDIITKFKFSDRSVDTKIRWADDGTPATEDIRREIGSGAVIKEITEVPL